MLQLSFKSTSAPGLEAADPAALAGPADPAAPADPADPADPAVTFGHFGSKFGRFCSKT